MYSLEDLKVIWDLYSNSINMWATLLFTILSFIVAFYYNRKQSKLADKKDNIEIRQFRPEIIIERKIAGVFAVTIFNKSIHKINLQLISSNHSFQLSGHNSEQEYPEHASGKEVNLDLWIFEKDKTKVVSTASSMHLSSIKSIKAFG